MSDERLQDYITALLRERDGYERANNKTGVDEVNAELTRVGATSEVPAKRAAKRPASQKASSKQER